MVYVIYNKETGKIFKVPARSVGCYIGNYKTAGAAKAALTRAAKKAARKAEAHAFWNSIDDGSRWSVLCDKMIEAGFTKREAYTANREPEAFDRDDYDVLDVVTWREKFPVKMVKRVNLMSGKEYEEAEDTPNYCSPASEAYWSM